MTNQKVESDDDQWIRKASNSGNSVGKNEKALI